jgi:hypothetical protein
MSKRHDAIGIKQTIRYEWMEKTSNMLLAGMDRNSIQQELTNYLMYHKGDGSENQRSKNTCKFAVSNLMNIWFSPDSELIDFKDSAIIILSKNPSKALAIYWSLISAAYPFWFNVALQTGRLLNLQEQVTSYQIITRLKEQYGDRETVSRYTRYVIRSLVSWGVLNDYGCKGCYKKSTQLHISDKSTSILLVEAMLHAIPEGKESLKVLVNSPALFPFHLPPITSNYFEEQNRFNVINYGIDCGLLELKMK